MVVRIKNFYATPQVGDFSFKHYRKFLIASLAVLSGLTSETSRTLILRLPSIRVNRVPISSG
jgi:hypothetical protein